MQHYHTKNVFKLSQHLMLELLCLSFDFTVNRAFVSGCILLAGHRQRLSTTLAQTYKPQAKMNDTRI